MEMGRQQKRAPSASAASCTASSSSSSTESSGKPPVMHPTARTCVCVRARTRALVKLPGMHATTRLCMHVASLLQCTPPHAHFQQQSGIAQRHRKFDTHKRRG